MSWPLLPVIQSEYPQTQMKYRRPIAVYQAHSKFASCKRANVSLHAVRVYLTIFTLLWLILYSQV